MAFARDLVKFSRIGNLNEFTNLSSSGILNSIPFTISVRTTKHYHPKFKWLRGKKVLDTILPKTERDKELQQYQLETLGIRPRYWKNRMMTITSAHEFIDPYKPPVGDGKVSELSNNGVVDKLKTGSKSFIAEKTALRKIKNYEPDFKKPIFLQEAHDLYVKAHTVLQKLDPEELCKYATEKAVQQMLEGLKYRTIRWKFLESLEPPQLMQSRVAEIFVERNLFAQLTVRFHTKQMLAIYDRFGRLMYGSEIVPKDVLEYVVFEKHINNEYGTWKILGKIIPEWKEPPYVPRTYAIEKEVEVEDEDDGFLPEDYASFEKPTEIKETAEILKVDSKA